jgi:hypothetical protein
MFFYRYHAYLGMAKRGKRKGKAGGKRAGKKAVKKRAEVKPQEQAPVEEATTQ